MEEKVEYILKLFQEDGDSFIKKAEMYYKRRPEFIEFVEESRHAYRALAQRYDKLSTELQNANTTIATCLPDQVHYSMDDDDEDYNVKGHKAPKGVGPPKGVEPPKGIQQSAPPPNVPKVPNAPIKSLKGIISDASKKLSKKPTKPTYAQIKPKPPPKSGLTEAEASEEVDKLQKDILALQTMKEFVKSSYENGLEKFRKIESEIMEKQDRASKLQDEFGITSVIENNDARDVMAKTALKSCQDTLAQLQSQQDKSSEEAEAETKRLEKARLRVKELRKKFLPDEPSDNETSDQHDDPKALGGESTSINQEVGPQRQKLEEIIETIKKLDESSGSITVTELAEKINELVNEVIHLESSVSSQTVLKNRLKTEADDLESHIQHFEDEKETTKHGPPNVSERVKDLEKKLKSVEVLNQNVKTNNNNFRTHLSVVHSSLDKVSEKLHTVKSDEEGEQSQEASDSEDKGPEKTKAHDIPKVQRESPDEVEGGDINSNKPTTTDISNEDIDPDDEANLPQLLLNGVEDKDKILKKEYDTIIRNYKEIKKRILNEEKTSDALFQTTVQVRVLRIAVAKRDKEIQALRDKLQENAPEAGVATVGEDAHTHPEDEVEEEINSLINESKPESPFEKKLKDQIDGILDENLDFFLRFSTTFHQIQKFKNSITDLQDEISKFKAREAKKAEGKPDQLDIEFKSDVRAVFRHLNEIKSELRVWLEQSDSLKEELQTRFSSLCSIQQTIIAALKEGVEKDEIAFTSHQAAKYQGEVLNMKQENKKVNEELQGGIDNVTSLQTECEDAIKKLDEAYGLTENAARNVNKPGIPLRSFIFGNKEKKKKPGLLSYMHPKK
ncbi:kinase-interacting protein 1 [Daucus carota subsp. sativus]